jgi:hypothetical protein
VTSSHANITELRALAAEIAARVTQINHADRMRPRGGRPCEESACPG